MKGTVKSYSTAHLYGFLIGDGGKDYFFMRTDWKASKKPEAGYKVQFDPVETSHGLRAENIRGLKE